MSQAHSSRREFLGKLAAGSVVVPVGVGAAVPRIAAEDSRSHTETPESLGKEETRPATDERFVFDITDFGAVPDRNAAWLELRAHESKEIAVPANRPP